MIPEAAPECGVVEGVVRLVDDPASALSCVTCEAGTCRQRSDGAHQRAGQHAVVKRGNGVTASLAEGCYCDLRQKKASTPVQIKLVCRSRYLRLIAHTAGTLFHLPEEAERSIKDPGQLAPVHPQRYGSTAGLHQPMLNRVEFSLG